MPQLVDLSGAVLDRKITSPNQTFDQYLTVEEDHRDETIITEHPVDSGAVMSDHIYLKPPAVKLRLGWSNADENSSGPSYVRQTYANLLQLKNARKLFTVYTGKRLYNNMFVAVIGVPTTPQSEWSMIAEIELRQLLLVSTKTVAGKPTSTTAAASPNAPNNGAPTKTTPTTDTGTALTDSYNQVDSGAGGGTGAASPVKIPGFTTEQHDPNEFIEPPGIPNSSGGGAGPLTPPT